ncbi:unnamed protein product, partial [Heterosigma akashiwo]
SERRLVDFRPVGWHATISNSADSQWGGTPNSYHPETRHRKNQLSPRNNRKTKKTQKPENNDKQISVMTRFLGSKQQQQKTVSVVYVIILEHHVSLPHLL